MNDIKFDYHAVGRRKLARARVWIRPGSGSIVMNKKHLHEVCKSEHLIAHAVKPLKLLGLFGGIDIRCTTVGGGVSGQMQAIAHGISKSLILMDPSLRTALKSAGLLTRDSRMVESKKYGRAKARKRFQYTKR